TRTHHTKPATSATTRTAGSRPIQSARRLYLAPSQIIASRETSLEYRIDRLLGAGGFGQVYLGRRTGRSSTIPDVVCVKASTRIDGWLREAYFGQLLDDHPRALRVYDRFPLLRDGADILYCLVLEYARHGDLRAFLASGGAPWSEAAA